MNLKVGDFILVKTALHGISTQADLGPWIVQVTGFTVDGIGFKHFSRLNLPGEYSCSEGTVLYGEVVCKIHEKDVYVLFKETKRERV